MTRKTPADESNYVMADAEHANELGRLQKLEGVRDPDTINYIETVGVAAGWRCVDIGAGAGSVARHLSSLTGPDGVVIAADMDTRFLGGFDGPGQSTLIHDITSGPVPPQNFDLAHCRALLTHVKDLPTALNHIAESVRPGGWVLCEEPDYVSMEPCDPDHPHAADLATFRAIMTLNGRQDGYVGRKLFNLFRHSGLQDVRSEGRTAVVDGGSPAASFRIHGIEDTHHLLLESGLFDNAAVDRLIRVSDSAAGYMVRVECDADRCIIGVWLAQTSTSTKSSANA